MYKKRQIEFKSYGLYSEVAKSSEYTVDQVQTVYDWYIKNTIKEITSGEKLQAYLPNLGKLKFHAKKGMSRLIIQQRKVTEIIGHYNRNAALEVQDTSKDESFGRTKLERIIALLLNRYDKVELTRKAYINLLEKINMQGAISEDQYQFQKNRFKKFSEKQTEIYESIQRVLGDYQERTQKH